MYQSTFMGLNTALRGVLAHQNALDVTSHNISNLSTQGYSRQRAEMVTAPAWSNSSAMSAVTPGQMGTGVEVLRIERLRDQFIDANVRQQFGRQANSQALVEQLAQVEAAFQEPGDNGLKALMSEFWNTMDAVATNASFPGARQDFAEATAALAAGFRQLSADLQAVATQSDLRLDDTVAQINGISQRIAQLNAEIRTAIEHNHQPNDLLDERDRLMDELSTFINYTSTTNASGEVTITFGSATPNLLVDPMVAGGFNALTRVQLDTAFGNGDLTSGRAFADQTLLNTIIPNLVTDLDNLVADFVADVNAAHNAGFDLNGNPGTNIFEQAGAGALTAAGMRLVDTPPAAATIVDNPNLIAAASSWVGPGEPGNGQNLRSMLDNLRNASQGALGGQSWEGFYIGTVTSVGARTKAANRDMANADVLVAMAAGRRDQVSGVSLDEEMSNMLRFQHAYNASARVMTSMDDMLDTMINRMGRVGL